MARVNAMSRRSDALSAIGVLLLVGVLLVALLQRDGAKQAAELERDRATAQVGELQRQSECTSQLQAQYNSALLAFLVALSSGEGADVARVDAQLALQQWLDAQKRCALPE